MLTSSAHLNNDVSGDLFRLVEAESIALGRGRVQRLSKDATNAVVPCLTVDVQAAATLEATLVTASDPTLLPDDVVTDGNEKPPRRRGTVEVRSR